MGADPGTYRKYVGSVVVCWIEKVHKSYIRTRERGREGGREGEREGERGREREGGREEERKEERECVCVCTWEEKPP